MSRFGAKKGPRMPGAEFTFDADPGREPVNAPTPLYPKYIVPFNRKLTPLEQKQVDLYRAARGRIHEGPYYSVVDAASLTAKKGSAARANFDAFHGMPTFSSRYLKKPRTLPKMNERPYVMKLFPRELWQPLQPNYQPGATMDGYVPQKRAGLKRGFEDDEDDTVDDAAAKRRAAGGGGDEAEVDAEADERDVLDGDEEPEDEIVDDDFEDDDDEMGGDYNAEQYFDAGDDEFGEDGFGDGGGGGDEETY